MEQLIPTYVINVMMTEVQMLEAGLDNEEVLKPQRRKGRRRN